MLFGWFGLVVGVKVGGFDLVVVFYDGFDEGGCYGLFVILVEMVV